MIALHFVSLRKQSIIGTQCPECGCSWILHSLHSLYFVRACTNLELSTNLDWQKWRFLRNILPHTTWCYTTIITMLWYYKDFENDFDLSKRKKIEIEIKKKIVCLFKKIPATNIISVYSYTGSMAFGPNVSKPENENWNSYGDSSAGNSLCKNCIFGINK